MCMCDRVFICIQLYDIPKNTVINRRPLSHLSGLSPAVKDKG